MLLCVIWAIVRVEPKIWGNALNLSPALSICFTEMTRTAIALRTLVATLPHFLCMNTSSNSDLKTVASPFIPQQSWKVHFLLELVTWPSLRNDYVTLIKPATLTWRHYTIGYDCACAKAINSTPIWRRLLRKRGFIGCCGRIGERLLEDEPEGFCERSWNICVILTLWVLTWT